MNIAFKKVKPSARWAARAAPGDTPRVRLVAAVSTAVLVTGCPPGARLDLAPGRLAPPPPARPLEPPGGPDPEAPAPAPEPEVVPAVLNVDVPLDKRAWVQPGRRDANRVLVYLHGRCGNPGAFQAFGRAAWESGTLVSLRGEKKCDYNQQWGMDLGLIHRRIRRAVEAAGKVVALPLATYPVTLIGYSQGATRAEQLARQFPDEYKRVVLIGGPTEPQVGALGKAERVAILAGEWDARKHLKEGLEKLREAKVPVFYKELPKVGHGSYGPAPEPVLAEALRFVRD